MCGRGRSVAPEGGGAEGSLCGQRGVSKWEGVRAKGRLRHEKKWGQLMEEEPGAGGWGAGRVRGEARRRGCLGELTVLASATRWPLIQVLAQALGPGLCLGPVSCPK